jgi:hypothetical protein
VPQVFEELLSNATVQKGSSSMYRSIAGAGLLATASLLTSVALPRPVAARRAAPNIRGSYFGSFQSTGGDFWTADMTLTIQTARRVSGQMNMAGIIRGAGVSGTFSPTQEFTLIGRAAKWQRPMRMKLRGRASIDPDNNRVTLSGTYQATGSVRESGNFELVGTAQTGPDL